MDCRSGGSQTTYRQRETEREREVIISLHRMDRHTVSFNVDYIRGTCRQSRRRSRGSTVAGGGWMEGRAVEQKCTLRFV